MTRVERWKNALLHRQTVWRALGGMVALTGCVGTGFPLTGQRAQAERVVLQIVADRDPVIEPAPVANCVARFAAPEQIPPLAAGGDAAIVALDLALRRSTTQECLAEAGSPDFFI
ncbi:MAG: hypothetical protein AAGJ91_06575 [Pseudomonadota bacterium]